MRARQVDVMPRVAPHSAQHARVARPDQVQADPARAPGNPAEKDLARVALRTQIVAQRLGQDAVQVRLYAPGLGLLRQPIVHAVRLFSTSKCTHTG